MRVSQANRLALDALERDHDAFVGSMEQSLRAAVLDSRFKVSRLEWPGLSHHFLVVERKPQLDPMAGIRGCQQWWGLSNRQAEVLHLLAQGMAYKTIAHELGCTLKTVEQHVTAILEKSGAESRAEVVARFWTQLMR